MALLFLLLLTSGLAYVVFRLLLSSCLDLLLGHFGGRLDYGCLIDHRFDEDCLELLARSEVQLELFMQVSRIGARMIQRGFDLAHEILMRHALIEELYCLVELVHKYLTWHLEAREQHYNLPVEVGHAVSRAPNYSKSILRALELSHGWPHLDLALHALLL